MKGGGGGGGGMGVMNRDVEEGVGEFKEEVCNMKGRGKERVWRSIRELKMGG